MKRSLQQRLPLLASLVLFVALCVALAYWVLQLYKPPLRMVAAPPPVSAAEVSLEAAANLFGGRIAPVAVASNFQLKGVVDAGNPRESVAILSADGKPALAVRVGAELQPGVTVREVHASYVLLSEAGVLKRVELPDTVPPSSGRGIGGFGGSAPVYSQPQFIPQIAPPPTLPPQPVPAPAPPSLPPKVIYNSMPEAPLVEPDTSPGNRVQAQPSF